MNLSINWTIPHWARQALMFVALASIWLLSATMSVLTANLLAVIVCLFFAAWFFIAIGTDGWKDELNLHSYQRAQRNTYFRNQTEFFAVGLAPIILSFLSIWTFVPFTFAYSVIDRGDGVVEYHEGFHIALINPFTVEVRHFSADYSNSTTAVCLGKTADGRGVRAKVDVALALPFSGLENAYKMTGDSRQLSRHARSELCNRFATIVETYAIDNLPSSLSLESRTADARHGMHNLGLRYAGTISIEGIKAYVVEK